MPVAVYLERVSFKAVQILLFSRVDLDLQLERPTTRFGVKLEDEVLGVLSLRAVALAEP
jgi:hypothetical protein